MKINSSEIIKTAKLVIRNEARALADTEKSVGADFARIVNKIADMKGRLVVCGIGKSGLIGRKISATLSSTGTPSLFIHPVECLHGDMGMVLKEDIVLALSFSGRTGEVVDIVKILKKRGLFVIAMTGVKNSALAKTADISIVIPVKKEACPHGVIPTSSTTAMLAVGDALAVSLMRAKNFTQNDFAELHPGGNLGLILASSVKDLMIGGKNNPIITEGKKVIDALSVMTKTRLGAVSVIDKKGTLAGFFTDGDLRRALIKNPAVLSAPICSVMTKNPMVVCEDTPAINAAKILIERKFDNMPVVNARGRLTGILDERALLEIMRFLNKENE